MLKKGKKTGITTYIRAQLSKAGQKKQTNKQTRITRPGHCRTGSGWLINGMVGLMGFSDKNVIW